MRVVGLDGRWYLELVPPGRGHPDVPDGPGRGAHRARRRRDPAGEAEERDLSEGTFRPSPADLVVTLRLLPGATWVADYYPVESAEDVPAADGGGLVVRVRTADTARLRRLVWRMGGSAVVLDPPEVVAEVATGAQAALTAYPATAGDGEG